MIPFNIDARYKALMLFRSMPISINVFVKSKYLSSIFISFTTIISYYGFILLFSRIFGSDIEILDVMDLITALFMAIFIISLLLPIFFKVGMFISMAVSLFIVSIVSVSYYYLSVFLSGIFENSYIAVVLMFIVSAGSIFISYFNSFKIFKKKEL
jgi:hypothetical protein